MATKSPRSMRRDTSRSASTGSPPGRRYVLEMSCSSIMLGSSWLGRALGLRLAHAHLVSLAQAVHDLAVGLVAGPQRDPALLARGREHVGPSTLAAYRAAREGQHVLARLDRDAHAGGH